MGNFITTNMQQYYIQHEAVNTLLRRWMTQVSTWWVITQDKYTLFTEYQYLQDLKPVFKSSKYLYEVNKLFIFALYTTCYLVKL